MPPRRRRASSSTRPTGFSSAPSELRARPYARGNGMRPSLPAASRQRYRSWRDASRQTCSLKASSPPVGHPDEISRARPAGGVFTKVCRIGLCTSIRLWRPRFGRTVQGGGGWVQNDPGTSGGPPEVPSPGRGDSRPLASGLLPPLPGLKMLFGIRFLGLRPGSMLSPSGAGRVESATACCRLSGPSKPPRKGYGYFLLRRGRRRRERGPRVEADRVAGWIDDQGDGSDAVRQVEGEPGRDGSSQLLRFLAAGLDVGHLDIDHSVERRRSCRPQRGASRSPCHPRRSPPPDQCPGAG